MGNCFALKKKQKAPELPQDEKKPNTKKDPKKGEKPETKQAVKKDPKQAAEVEPQEEPLEEKQEPIEENQEPKSETKQEPKQVPKPETKREPKREQLEVPEEKQEEEQDELEEIINQHQIVVFSKTVCPLSDDAKGILEEEGIDYTLVELDTCKGFSNLENQLGQKSGRECVPVIYVNGQLLGGACELSRAVESGKLAEMIKQKKKSPSDPSPTANTVQQIRPRRMPETQKPTQKNRYEK